MNFIEAVKLGTENGKKIKREYWTCQYIRFIDFGNELEVVLTSNIGIESKGKYIPTSTDIIATDWELCSEKPKNVTFQEAFKALKNGKRIRRLHKNIVFCKQSDSIINKSYIGNYAPRHKHKEINDDLFSYEDICATDWIIQENVKYDPFQDIIKPLFKY